MNQINKKYYIYIITNKNNGTLYVGVTNDLVRRIYEHRNKLVDGFSTRLNLTMLVYYEVYENIEKAIEREKYFKKAYRKEKVKLVNSFNPEWVDL